MEAEQLEQELAALLARFDSANLRERATEICEAQIQLWTLLSMDEPKQASLLFQSGIERRDLDTLRFLHEHSQFSAIRKSAAKLLPDDELSEQERLENLLEQTQNQRQRSSLWNPNREV